MFLGHGNGAPAVRCLAEGELALGVDEEENRGQRGVGGATGMRSPDPEALLCFKSGGEGAGGEGGAVDAHDFCLFSGVKMLLGFGHRILLPLTREGLLVGSAETASLSRVFRG